MPQRKVGPWLINSTKTVYDNPWIAVDDHEVTRPDGAPGQYGVVHFKNLAIGVMPIDADGNVRLVGQHRFPQDRYSWELPEGGGPLDQPPLESAKRELIEETGLVAASWEELCQFDISNSVTDERAICYIAWDLTQKAPEPDPTEILTRKTIPFVELFEMVISGEITDSLTIVMTLMVYAKALRGEGPEPICSLKLEPARRT